MPSLVEKICSLCLIYITVNLAGAQLINYKQTCRDQSLNCQLWKQREYCSAEGSIGKMMLELCKMSCGLCSSANNNGVCTDKNALCPTWDRVEQCNAQMKDYMHKNCPKSCKKCGVDSCEDIYQDCLTLAKMGYCQSDEQWSKLNCRKTCRSCIASAECGRSFLSCGPNTKNRPTVGNGWQGRIVGGDTTVLGEVPWQVLIDVLFTQTKGNTMFCGGAILTQKWVVSAGHCFHRGWDILRLSFGAIYNFAPTQVQKLEARLHRGNVRIHPDYHHKVKDNDIAVVKLIRPVTYTNEIRPVCLPSPNDYQEGQTAIVTGWGTVAYRGRPSNLLMKVCLKVRDCTEFTKVNFTITDNMICAYEEGKDACQGDSGGPLVVRGNDNRFVLLGIVSKGKGCAMQDMPGAYTKVSNYILWLSKITSEEGDW